MRVLRAHLERPLRPSELERRLGWASQSSLRAAVKRLRELGALAEASRGDSSLAGALALTDAGRDLLFVADALEGWLGAAPGGPVPIEDAAAHGLVKALVAAWDSGMVRALAQGPRRLPDFERGGSGVSYPALKRRLAKLRSTEMVLPMDSGSGGLVYAATDWLRRGVAPLIAAARWERLHDPAAEPVSALEVEAAFLMAIPLAVLPRRPGGRCAMVVSLGDRGGARRSRRAGVELELDAGVVVSLDTDVGAGCETWAAGGLDAWFAALAGEGPDALQTGGAKPRLATRLVKALGAVFRPPPAGDRSVASIPEHDRVAS